TPSTRRPLVPFSQSCRMSRHLRVSSQINWLNSVTLGPELRDPRSDRRPGCEVVAGAIDVVESVFQPVVAKPGGEEVPRCSHDPHVKADVADEGREVAAFLIL